MGTTVFQVCRACPDLRFRNKTDLKDHVDRVHNYDDGRVATFVHRAEDSMEFLPERRRKVDPERLAFQAAWARSPWRMG